MDASQQSVQAVKLRKVEAEICFECIPDLGKRDRLTAYRVVEVLADHWHDPGLVIRVLPNDFVVAFGVRIVLPLLLATVAGNDECAWLDDPGTEILYLEAGATSNSLAEFEAIPC